MVEKYVNYVNKGEADRGLKVRPLGEVSNFVVEKMPHMLDQIQAGGTNLARLEETASNLVTSINNRDLVIVFENPRARDVASLDLKMLETAIIASGGMPSEKLMDLIKAFSSACDQPGGLTYEEIVKINPSGDMRKFTTGEVGRTEKTFYKSHRIIEEHLDTGIVQMQAGILALRIDGKERVDDVSENLNLIRGDLLAIISKTHSLGMQNQNHFKQFRQYLGGNNLRGTKGPSGAFTAGIPTIEILLAGEKLPQDYIKYLQDNEIYFPRDGRKKIKDALADVNDGLTFTLIAEQLGRPEPLMQAIEGISKLIRGFRGEHYKAVRNQIPQAVVGGIAGTGGEPNPGAFLRGRMEIRHV